ncbi:hypothetical protein BAE44_0021121 [Dichanthelium oligosanthes]|uniref:Protein odr-4-like protein n=1 Tax=Dichanthelium oligosanthes TaxID=888268 RepID=A0A1E5UYB9_9POAL|nr:hypothetical protein BAE44_0021121 [Dichanthelium oligosanthes]
MVKAVVGDEAHLKAFEEALSSSSSAPPQAQVGLVVGKLSASSDRALVYSLLPTPPTDAAAPACSLRAASKSKPSKGKAPSSSDASLEFDVDWIAEHARQVSRMLLGGMSVIGVYVWASEVSFKATSPAVLSQVIRAVSQAWYGSAFSERLLIHISYSPRRLTAVQAEPFKKVILKAISHLTEEVQNARALVDGRLADIITSLRSRLDIILDEADDVSATDGLEKSPSQKATQVVFHELREPYSFSFPRRVLIPWLSGAYVCDYLQGSETTEDATDRCKEVISLETAVESFSILEPENAAACGTLESFWDMVPGARSGGRDTSSRLKDSGCSGQEDGDRSRRQQGGGNFNVLAGLFALLVALIAGLVFTFSAGSDT